MRTAVAALLFVGATLAGVAVADHPDSRRTPRVYGATGRPYGPTQAHYQYEKRYGRPWHGLGGERRSTRAPRRYTSAAPSFYRTPHVHFGGPGYSTGYWDYGPVYSTIPTAPVAVQAFPQWIGRDPFHNDVLRRAQLENELRWKMPLILFPTKSKLRKAQPSTPAAKLKSLHAQGQGEHHMRRQDYHRAYERFKAAVRFAPDRADAHFRTAFALAAIGHFDSAVRYFKRGLQLDPSWPADGESLGRVFGRGNELAKTSMLGRATAWAKQDIRNPDRLFLLGVLLHFDNHADKSAVLFESAYRLKGGGEHVKAFLVKAPGSQPERVRRPKLNVAVAAVRKPVSGGIVEIKPPLPPIEPPEPRQAPGRILPPLPKP